MAVGPLRGRDKNPSQNHPLCVKARFGPDRAFCFEPVIAADLARRADDNGRITEQI